MTPARITACIVTAMRDAMEALAAEGNFHARVALHHFHQMGSERDGFRKPSEAIQQTNGFWLLHNTLRAHSAPEGRNSDTGTQQRSVTE